MQSLETLDISGNPLTTIPDGVIPLENLVLLDAPDGPLHDLLYSEADIGKFEKRLHEWIDANPQERIVRARATQRISDCFCNGYEELNLEDLNLTELPEAIGNLLKLKRLYCGKNCLTTLPESLTRLNLDSLNISQNNFEVFPLVICQMQSLETLDISGNPLTTIPDGVTPLENLSALAVPEGPLSNLLFKKNN